MDELIFLKLGGSLITDKTRPYTSRLDVLESLSTQIADAIKENSDMRLLIGHGSGSFGHVVAKEHHTREGGESSEYWRGFAEVWYQASALNRIVMNAMQKAGVRTISMPPVSSVTARDGKVAYWNLTSIKAFLAARLVPVVYGDVVHDIERGGTILSTEDLFEHLARELKPQRILLAGLEGAVWADFPARKLRVERITPASYNEVRRGVGASHGADVTGGMDSKVRQMLDLVQEIPGLTAQIFSGEEPGNLKKALEGEVLGTLVTE